MNLTSEEGCCALKSVKNSSCNSEKETFNIMQQGFKDVNERKGTKKKAMLKYYLVLMIIKVKGHHCLPSASATKPEHGHLQALYSAYDNQN